MPAKYRNPFGESKKNVKCGICGHGDRHDNLKSRKFPQQHPGEKYIEQGETSLTSFFTPKKNSATTSLQDASEDVDMEDVESNPKDPIEEEKGEKEKDSNTSNLANLIQELTENLKVNLHVNKDMSDNAQTLNANIDELKQILKFDSERFRQAQKI